MKTLLIYDSLYGHTKVIAQAINDALPDEVRMLQAGEVNPAELGACDLLIVGAPTHGGQPSDPVKELLGKVPASALEGVKAAAFDTRHTARLLRLFGFAAPRIAKSLKEKGGTLVSAAEGFFVTGGKGPLREGEVERAAAWAKDIVGLVD